MKAPPHLFVGAVENPTAPPLEHRAERALKKVDAGARFLQLQIHYRPEQLEALRGGLRRRTVSPSGPPSCRPCASPRRRAR